MSAGHFSGLLSYLRSHFFSRLDALPCRFPCCSHRLERESHNLAVCLSHVLRCRVTVNVQVVRMSECRMSFYCTPIGVPIASIHIRYEGRNVCVPM